MPSAPTLLAFSAAATALVLLPGPNLIYIVSRGIAQGRRAALASTLGVTCATTVFVVLTAFGLTALISSSALAFAVVKYAGVAYLVHLAVREFRSRGRVPAGGSRRRSAPAGPSPTPSSSGSRTPRSRCSSSRSSPSSSTPEPAP